MSTHEQKVEVITEWLVRQATQRRMTNILEVQQYAGLRLAELGQRHSSNPIDRYKAFDALATIAEQSNAEHGFLLPALVVHFSDGKPGRRLREWAEAAGLLSDDEDAPDTAEFHAQEVKEIFDKYAASVPDDASSLA